MISITARAPGKLVLLGDYAVLEGAPALAVAIHRHACVQLAPLQDRSVVVCAPDVGVTAARGQIDAAGRLQWDPQGAPATPPPALVSHVWNALATEGFAPRQGLRITLDTAGFFEHSQGARTPTKLGLGSSAALTVALAAALAAASCGTARTPDFHSPKWLARLVTLHRSWQNGRGSGIDIAASLAGGLIRYTQDAARARPALAHASWPPAGTACLFVWSGQAVSTPQALQQLATWQQGHPADYRAHMDTLCGLAHAAPAALHGSARDFVALVAAYAAALKQFAQASGLAIFSPEQHQLMRLAALDGASYKPCGAGGDFGVVVADDPQRLARVQARITQAGLHPVALTVARQGLQWDAPDGTSV